MNNPNSNLVELKKQQRSEEKYKLEAKKHTKSNS
jgi:hypothetical protein